MFVTFIKKKNYSKCSLVDKISIVEEEFVKVCSLLVHCHCFLHL